MARYIPTLAAKLVREDDEVVHGDSAYLGFEKRDEIKQDPQRSTIDFRINRRPGTQYDGIIYCYMFVEMPNS